MDWVNRMVTVTKPNGKLRICIDPRDLNRAINVNITLWGQSKKSSPECPTLKCSQSSMPTLASGKSHSITRAPDYAPLEYHLPKMFSKLLCPRCSKILKEWKWYSTTYLYGEKPSWTWRKTKKSSRTCPPTQPQTQQRQKPKARSSLTRYTILDTS